METDRSAWESTHSVLEKKLYRLQRHAGQKSTLELCTILYLVTILLAIKHSRNTLNPHHCSQLVNVFVFMAKVFLNRLSNKCSNSLTACHESRDVVQYCLSLWLVIFALNGWNPRARN